VKNEILSQNEINNLLSSVTEENESGNPLSGIAVGDGNDDTANPAHSNIHQKPRVKMHDFKRPDRFSRDQMRTIQMLHESCARLLTSSLSADLRTLVNIRVASVDQLTYEEFTRSIPNPTTLGLLTMDPLKGKAIIEVDPGISFALLDKLYGGSGKTLKYNRELTEVETSIMELVIIRFLGCLREAWLPILDLRSRLDQIETNVQYAQIIPPSEMVVLVTLETMVGDEEGMMNFCLPWELIRPIMPRLKPKNWYQSDSGTGYSRTSTALPVINHLRDSRIDCAAVIPGSRISLGDIRSLKKGSLIELDCDAANSIQLISANNVLAEFTWQESKKGIIPGRVLRDLPEFSSAAPEDKNNTGQSAEKCHEKTEEALKRAEKATALVNRMTASLKTQPFDFIRRADPQAVLQLLVYEHPQAIALVLSHFEPAQAAKILSCLPAELQEEVTQKIACMDTVMPETLRTIERVLEKQFSEGNYMDVIKSGGIDAAVNILNQTDRATEKAIIEAIKEKNPELAEELKKRMFVFEDIVLLDDRNVQKVLREVDTTDLIIALKVANETVLEKVYRNMSKRAVELVKEDMEYIGPVQLRDVERAQERILAIIRKLEEQGEIIVARAGEDEMIK